MQKYIKTEKELNADIMAITVTIQELFPELSKYLTEMPITIPTDKNPNVNTQNLLEYYNSLDTLLKEYDSNHGQSGQ